MPPKKRTSTVANANATEPSPKRTRKPAGSETAAASRPKRFPQLPPRAAKTKAAALAAKPSPAKRAVATTKAQAQETPRKRGRPAATVASPAVKKGITVHDATSLRKTNGCDKVNPPNPPRPLKKQLPLAGPKPKHPSSKPRQPLQVSLVNDAVDHPNLPS